MQSQLIADRYRVLRAIGHGGMGTVWLCRDETLGRQVAVKQIESLSDGPAAETARAMREARLTAGLTHPNAVALHDVVVHASRPWLVMEFVDGQTLAAEIPRDGRLTPERVASIGVQVASALAQAHERRIVHRDIKPGNVLIDKAGNAKISDFGLARGHGDARLTRTGSVTGTFEFWSPELARGADADSASDVWALGATLYAAVEGRTPYDSGGHYVTLLQTIATSSPRVLTHAGALGPAIYAMMQLDPAHRWDMRTCAERLAAIATGDTRACDPPREAGGPAEPTRQMGPPAGPTWQTAPAAGPTRQTGPAAGPTRQTGPAGAHRPELRGSRRRWVPLGLVALLIALSVLGLGGTYLLSESPDEGSNVRTFKCGADGFTGYIRFSDTSMSIVSYKIDPAEGSKGNSAEVTVSDGGVTPPRRYGTREGKQDSAYHALEGPYSRGGGGFSFTFAFDKNNRNDPTCSGKEYLAG